MCGRRAANNVDIELQVHHIVPWSDGGLTLSLDKQSTRPSQRTKKGASSRRSRKVATNSYDRCACAGPPNRPLLLTGRVAGRQRDPQHGARALGRRALCQNRPGGRHRHSRFQERIRPHLRRTDASISKYMRVPRRRSRARALGKAPGFLDALIPERQQRALPSPRTRPRLCSKTLGLGGLPLAMPVMIRRSDRGDLTAQCRLR